MQNIGVIGLGDMGSGLAKNLIKAGLEAVGITRWKDHHVWHPTYAALIQLIKDNGFEIEDTYWQLHWNDTVCYVCARKPG